MTFYDRMIEVLSEYTDDGITPQQINNGYCADFACVVVATHKESRLWSDEDMGAPTYTHTFIEYRGKYYDAECLDGVDDWKSLPIFTRQRLEGYTY